MMLAKTEVTHAAAVAALITIAGMPAAKADLRSAETAYQKGDFTAAFAAFKELAELGQPVAQYDLAAMYVRGEGTNLSNTFAHAWASLAAANGEKRGSELAAQTEPELSPVSLQISADLQRKYSNSALDARLLPKILHGREYADRDPVRPSKPFIPSYPQDAQRKGVQGAVYVSFTVAPDGRPRMPRILYALPTGYFEGAVQESVLRSVYLPGRINGTPTATPVSIFYRFAVTGVSLSDYGDLQHTVEKTKEAAQAGDPAKQMLYGMMLAGLPQLNQTYEKALPWFLKAAQAGAPYAQYQIGTGLLQGRGCECDANKGEIWLEKAAQSDQADAQVSLAEYLLADTSKPDTAGARIWLERAVKQGNSTGKLLLAAMLAASPAADQRDPKRAEMLASELQKQYKIDPSYWEVAAAAHAAKGNFKAALEAQNRALTAASRLGWDESPMQARRELYSASKPYIGSDLLF